VFDARTVGEVGDWEPLPVGELEVVTDGVPLGEGVTTGKEISTTIGADVGSDEAMPVGELEAVGKGVTTGMEISTTIGEGVGSGVGRGAEIKMGASDGLALCPSALPTSKSVIRILRSILSVVVCRHWWHTFVPAGILL
jgi:hypothetical protein